MHTILNFKYLIAQAFIVFLILFISVNVSGQQDRVFESFCEQSQAQVKNPIRLPDSGIQPIWNEKALMFKFAPSFTTENKSWIIPQPSQYRFTAFSFNNHQTYSFTDSIPNASLSPIWSEIPNGEVYLKTEAVSKDKQDIVLINKRLFYKTASFCPPYPAAQYGYSEAFDKGMTFMYQQPHIQQWFHSGRPDHEKHTLYCYSALEVGSVINAMVLHHKHNPKNDTSLVIACKAADYLISNSESKTSPLSGFPQVYEGDRLTAGKFSGEVLLTEPAATGLSYLNLFSITGDSVYLNAALQIAETYRKTQLTSGTWFIRLNKMTGQPASEVLCIPIKIVNFLQILTEEHHYQTFKPVIEAAIGWTYENPVKTFDWTGQFEDVEAVEPYENLTKYEASWFAQFLLNHHNEDTNNVQLAKALIDFCEDQFVVWEQPAMYDNWNNSTQSWHVPAVLEQYHCYVPIDASAVQMIDTYYLAYQKTGESIYREKALTLANSLVNTQEKSGKIPTFWASGFNEFWNNCMVSSLFMLDKLSNLEK